MTIQTKASYKKEMLAFSRTSRLPILAIIVVGWAMLGPLLIVGLGIMIDTLAPVYEELGMDVTEMADMLAANASTGVISGISDLTTVGLIAFLIILNPFAGGEQKSRSTMLPKTSGLENASYLLPKYIIYPATALILALIAGFASWGVSVLTFEINDVEVSRVALAGLLAGVNLMFFVCIHLTLGTASGKAGMSSAICIIASLLLPSLFEALGSEFVYNPFTLNRMATTLIPISPFSAFSTGEIITTTGIALALMVLLYFLALFVQNSKKIDNSGNEIRL